MTFESQSTNWRFKGRPTAGATVDNWFPFQFSILTIKLEFWEKPEFFKRSTVAM